MQISKQSRRGYVTLRRYQAAGMLLVVLLGSYATLKAQPKVPTDNPYVTRYGEGDHWTRQIGWQAVTVVTQVPGLLNRNNRVDSSVLGNTLRNIGKKGGVLYFPPGTYYLDFQLNMVSGVVLRGAAPAGIADARQPGYVLPTRFEFPRYRPAGNPGPMGAPNETAFKRIYADTSGLRNFGLVNLDISRAVIAFYAGSYRSVAGSSDTLLRPSTYHKNVILFGVRQNNAAVPDPRIPTPAQVAKGGGWQRWPWPYGANITVTVSRNCLVANCRLNDRTEDNFRQNRYVIEDGMTFDGSQAMFTYTDHVGISINALQVQWRGTTHAPGTGGGYHLRSSFPVAAPPVSGKGIQILDNYVRTSVGFAPILARGRDVMMTGNQTDSVASGNVVRAGNLALRSDYRLLLDGTVASEAELYVNHRGDTLPYRLVKPHNYNDNGNEKYPVVLFLHGDGESGKDNKAQLRHFLWTFATPENREKYPCFIIAPQKPVVPGNPEATAWVDDRPVSVSWKLAASMKILERVQKTHAIDPARVYVVGISSGGNAVWDALVRFPEKFAAAVPIASFYEITDTRARIIGKTPVWAFNGDSDEEIPLIFTRLMMVNLRRGSTGLKHTEFERTGHLCWDKVVTNPAFLPWLFAQKR